jgi:hypothetical protein
MSTSTIGWPSGDACHVRANAILVLVVQLRSRKCCARTDLHSCTGNSDDRVEPSRSL